ncbi:MAG: NUDIX domain-containing protein [Bacteroidota bacterium]
MNLFINDKPIRIVEIHDSLLTDASYDTVLNAPPGATLKASMLQGKVLIINAPTVLIGKLVDLFRDKKRGTTQLKRLTSITFAVKNKKEVIRSIKSNFRIIEAAGGVVMKDDKILIMHRLGKWDLPKGKLEKNEKAKQGAIREVEEECSVEVTLDYKVCSTWHTYTQNGSKMLKKTKWYAMTCINDAHMKPQIEEDIEQLIWMTPSEIQVAMFNSYASIQHVFEAFYAKKEIVKKEM